ncbi:MAG: helix-turn-helix domain-containing protein [Anaerolineae bacterium]
MAKLLTAEEAAKYIGVSQRTFWRRVASGLVKPVRSKGKGRDWRRQYFSQADLDALKREK